MEKEGITIYYHGNKGELEIRHQGGVIYADGFCERTNTVYEFYGDFWHGNPKIYPPEEINPHTGCSFGELYQKTLQREAIIRKRYKLVTIWESEWDGIC